MEMTGKKAVTFHLKDGHNNKFEMKDFEGRWLLLVFHRHLG